MKILIPLILLIGSTASLCQETGKKFEKLESYLFTTPDPGMKTEAFVLRKEGQIVFSRYDHGGPETLNLLWSMSKSVTSLLFGIAQEKGYLKAEDSIYKFYKKEIDAFPKNRKEALKKITLRHLLGMSSGLKWNEFYEEDPFNSHVVKMLYLESLGSTDAYVLKTPAKSEPGTSFLYSSGDTALLSGAMKRALPAELRDNYPWAWLFDPMGIQAVFEQDGSGTFLGGSNLYLKTKDLSKIGQLIIDRGLYGGKQLVPSSYVDFAISLSSYMEKRGCLEDSSMTYGAQFWLNAACPGGKKPFPSVPETLVMMLGHGGQSVFIFPKHKIVAVRISRDKEKALDKEKYASLILEALGEN